MNPLSVSARFAAHVWFMNQADNASKSRDEALRFAHDNWLAFLPVAHEGWGRLLIRVTAASAKRPALTMNKQLLRFTPRPAAPKSLELCSVGKRRKRA
jgi:hypothetical protein